MVLKRLLAEPDRASAVATRATEEYEAILTSYPEVV